MGAPLVALVISFVYLLLNDIVKEVSLTVAEFWSVIGNRARLYVKTFDRSYVQETAKYVTLAKACRFVTLLKFKMPNEYARLSSLSESSAQGILDFYEALVENRQGFGSISADDWSVILRWFNDGAKHNVDWSNESLASIRYKITSR